MAFRQPQQRPQVQRHASFSQSTPASEAVQQTAAHRRRLEEESQEWILFSPIVDEQQSTTSRISRTAHTANLSRLSDLDSLETDLRSGQYAIDGNGLTCQETELSDDDDDDDDDEGEELDSLDDGLHAFHGPPSPRLDQSGGTVLPMHDGMGTFPSTYAHAATDGMQEHLWQFERYNPARRRPQRRRSSVQKRLDALEDEEDVHGLDKHEERRLRIEKWRLEQSRAVLEEIERETKRQSRRMSILSGQTGVVPNTPTLNRSTSGQSIIRADEVPAEDHTETESFWQRITRSVIEQLMGLDETTLCVIFGEDLPPDASSDTPTQSSTIARHTDATWEQRLLERIARELGILADRLSEHEEAFSTHKDAPRSLQSQAGPALRSHAPAHATTFPDDQASINDALFPPTFPRTATLPTGDTSLWGIEEEPLPDTSSAALPDTDQLHQDKEYWERDLDVGVIFRYLRNRFSSTMSSPAPKQMAPRNIPTNTSTGPLPPAWASPDQNPSALRTNPESFRRADMIRRHHPLVSHAATISATRRESMLLRRQHQLFAYRRTAGSSCASQSTKRTRSGGSRRFWDFPNVASSATGGSAVSVTSGGYEGMMGPWGEV